MGVPVSARFKGFECLFVFGESLRLLNGVSSLSRSFVSIEGENGLQEVLRLKLKEKWKCSLPHYFRM